MSDRTREIALEHYDQSTITPHRKRQSDVDPASKPIRAIGFRIISAWSQPIWIVLALYARNGSSELYDDDVWRWAQ